ncbi:uncharacterized protein VP01_2412g7, partial [Puccinia sorghi]
TLRQTQAHLYAVEFNSHTHTVVWINTPLTSLYQHILKENIEIAMVMSKIEFNSLQEMQEMALKEGQAIEGIQNGCPALNLTSGPSSP